MSSLRLSPVLAAGTRLGAYEVTEMVGEGAMATVYAGVAKGESREGAGEEPVAIKLLRKKLARDVAIARRFARESESLRRIAHPNVVHVYDVGTHDEVPYFVMTYLGGGTLEDRRQGLAAAPTTREVRALAAPLASALDTIHAAGLVHRDISAANVMLMSKRAFVPVLLDFGIALQEEETRLTKKGSVLGTAPYLAPELTRGASHASPASDQYALGVLLFLYATGRYPFEGKSVYEVMAQIATKTPPPLASLRADLEPALCATVDRMLARTPTARYPTLDAAAL